MVGKKSHLLIEEAPLIVLPTLAALVGINEAIAIQQIHWVCRVKAEHEDYRTFHDDEMWCSYKIDQWLQKMPWLKDRTCRRMLSGLEERKILIVTKPHAKEWNHTKWYRVDYDVLDKIGCSIYQNCQTDVDNLTDSERTDLPLLDVDNLTDSSIDKKDIKEITKERVEEPQPKTGMPEIDPTQNEPTPEKNLTEVMEEKTTAAPRVQKFDPFIHGRTSALERQKAIAAQDSIKDSPFESVEEADRFYAYAFEELSKGSKQSRGAIENDAKWMVLRLQRNQADPRDRQYLSQFKGGLQRISRTEEIFDLVTEVLGR